MKKRLRFALVVGVILLLAVAVGWGYYRYRFPYGHTHRCSKVLSMYLTAYARDHEGKFPATAEPGSLGLSALLDQDQDLLEVVVGKAGDLMTAEEFYRDHGYLKPEHSSWHYVGGLTMADEGRAILWDKIPLGHNGQRTRGESREVIFIDGRVKNVRAEEWQEFVEAQSGSKPER